MMAHMASLIFGGVFEKYPTLKVVMQEGGVLWIAPYLWKLDQDCSLPTKKDLNSALRDAEEEINKWIAANPYSESVGCQPGKRGQPVMTQKNKPNGRTAKAHRSQGAEYRPAPTSWWKRAVEVWRI
ncbi:MAG: amidohydrolase [Paenibacillus sp.]|nr:amidohydrolase [Paenibacillus sp.]